MSDLKNQESYNLSPMQQGMFFHSQLSPGSGVDIEQIVAELNEKIDVNKFRNSWFNILQRHSILRTSFEWERLENPIQHVNDNVELDFVFEDLTQKNELHQKDHLENYYSSDRKRGFSLNSAPLMRVALFKLTEQKFVCVWTFHHILLDGRSFPIVLKDLFHFYNQKDSGDSLPVSKPFREYIDWLTNRDESDSIKFWKEYLAGFKSATPLGFNKFKYENEESKTGYDVHYHYLSEELTKAIIAFAEEKNLTVYTIVLAAWSLLLSRYSSENDVVLGATRSCRKNTVDGVDDIAGLFINTLPVRIKIDYESGVLQWIKKIREEQLSIRGHEHTNLMKIQNVSELHGEKHLFESILVFENYLLDSHLREQGGDWLNRNFKVLEQTNYPLTLFGYLDKELFFKLEYDKSRFSNKSAVWINQHLEHIIGELIQAENRKVAELSFVTKDEKEILLNEWNNTEAEFDSTVCLHQLFEKTAVKYPEKTALAVKNKTITYSELNKRANQVAQKLKSLGVKPGDKVAIYTSRSIEMIASIIGIHKAGGAYLPLDPEYPKDRIQFMVEDSEVNVLITQSELLNKLPESKAVKLILDSEFSEVKNLPENNLSSAADSESLAYLIYTSGSTGKPKGVMVTHRNVINFFKGMDHHIPFDENSSWLAVTSLSFDISVLELLWTLTRGLKVVLYTGDDFKLQEGSNQFTSIEFSLFYFSSYEGEKNTNKYKLLLEGSKFADQNSFNSVWTPERHFYDFGGLYPNPSVTSAAIAAITKKVNIRAGSVVSPLHNTIRIAEEWSVVDNISLGRVGISFAAGWQPNDFVIMPENFKDRKDLMFRQIDEVQKLWKGDKVPFNNPNGKEIQIGILPRPVQERLPVWVTAAGNPETFEMAGMLGHNLLTHLLGQSISELSEKISIYRKAWKEAGHKGKGVLTLMLHTFIGTDEKMVKETVRGPMKHYLKSAVNLVKEAAWSFPVFKNATTGKDGNFNMDNLTPEDLDAILDYSFERYYSTSGLFGTPESCKLIISKLKEIDVDEIACLIDFGVDSDLVLAHLYYLNQLRRESNTQLHAAENQSEYSIPSLIKKHSVTHMQCTPSMAKMLTMDKDSAEALSSLKVMLVGGEAFPLHLAQSLQKIVKGDILNMYGPTETTIWSTVYKLDSTLPDMIPIGQPIANTDIYILNESLQLNPIGVPGELCIGGEGVSNGYFNRPELTSEKFVDDKFVGKEKRKFYRTGDLAYYSDDGTIQFLGRLDHQVKMRGYRIELGEIETLLCKNDSVREGVVMAREDIPGDQRLVAYIVPQENNKIDINSIREMMREKLPEFMVPSNFVVMEKFPLTPNGKIDRKSFPAPSSSVTRSDEDEAVHSNNEFELKISEIWKDLLKLPKVGLKDNFFDIGGHSLLAVQLHARLKESVDDELTLIDIFRFPTISTIVEYIEKKTKTTETTTVKSESKRAKMSKQRFARARSRDNDSGNDVDVQEAE
ncbi:MAG: LLM class flavin-dependent oxidoreductase [Ignavibacteriales bacterium]|nr:MAG: LLM class flavin-dependent oxidoreductase [Ignavibacteriales bacterium]